MNQNAQRGSGTEAEAATEKNWKHGKCKDLIPYSRGGGGAAGGSGADFFFFFSRSGERFMPPPRDFRSGKGAWLGSRQNQTKMSGGLAKTDYERYLMSQNNPP